jgi:hypothetical protein
MYEQNNDLATGYIMGRDSTNCGNGNGFGWGSDWIWAILLLALIGNNGFGFGGGFGGFGGGFGGEYGFNLGKVATTNDVASGFNNSAVLSSLNDIKLGQSSLQNTLCQGFNGINTSLLQGFHGIDNAVCTLGYQNQQGFNSISHQISDCCCATQRAIDGVNYNMAKSTCDIIQSNTNNTQRIIDFLTSEKISSLQSENAGLKAQISNDRQSAYLLNELKPCPKPAFLTCNPNAPYGLGYGVNGCGCNNGF